MNRDETHFIAKAGDINILLVTYIVILISVAVITKIRFGTLIQGNVLFTAVWCCAVALATTGIYDLYKPIPIVHLYVMTVIIVFNVMYLLIKGIFGRKRVEKKILGEPRRYLLYIANISSWLFMIRFVSKSYAVILTGGLRALRSYAFNSEMGLGSTAELILAQTIVQPIFTVTILITIACIVIGKVDIMLVLISVIDIAIYIIAFGGRAILLLFLTYYLLLQVVWNYRGSFVVLLKRSVSISTIVIIVLVFSLLSFLTQERAWSETNSFKENYTYIVGSFSLLSVYFEHKDTLIQNRPYLFGKAMLGMIVNPILMSSTYAFGIPYKGSDYMITTITATPYAVSPNRRLNALNTMIYPLYRDFGYVGVILGTVFLAFLLARSEIFFNSSMTLLSLCLYVFILDMILKTTMNYYFLFPRTGFSIFFLMLFTGSKVTKHANKE